MTFPTHGHDDDAADFRPQTCSVCDETSDDDRPCSELCSRVLIRERRAHRVAGFKARIETNWKLWQRYVDESGVLSTRALDVLNQIHAYERMIADATEAQEREDEACAPTLPAPVCEEAAQ